MNACLFNKPGLFILLPAIAISCKNDHEEPQQPFSDTTGVMTESPIPVAPPAPINTDYYQDFACYYKMDDKYSEEQDTALISEWLMEKRAACVDGKLPPTLFNNGGPGPNGAEWNPSTDLYCLATLADTLRIKKMEVRLNNKTSRNIKVDLSDQVSREIAFAQFVIPYKTWTENQRPLMESEIVEVSGDAYQYPDAGTQVVQITLDVFFEDGSSKRFNEYFHTAYGE